MNLTLLFLVLLQASYMMTPVAANYYEINKGFDSGLKLTGAYESASKHRSAGIGADTDWGQIGGNVYKNKGSSGIGISATIDL